jgi:small subunit ribosomal protein S9
MEVINALGRRKAAVARVFVSEGTGQITINKRDISVYFPSPILQFIIKQPLTKLGVVEKYDIKVNLDGGGFNGQAGALRLAIARALVKINPEDKSALKVDGFMTRDPREVERKKPGQPKARKRFQFSKRSYIFKIYNLQIYNWIINCKLYIVNLIGLVSKLPRL